MFSKTIKATLATLFATIALTGCGGPKSATEVLNKAIENNIDNYHVSMTGSVEVIPTDKDAFDGLKLYISSNADVNKDIVHGSMGMSLNSGSEPVNDASVMQFYSETSDNKTIMYQQGTAFDVASIIGVPLIEDDTWQKSEIDQVNANTINLATYKDLFKKAQFKDIDGIYYVGIKLSDILNDSLAKATKEANKDPNTNIDIDIDFSKFQVLNDTMVTFTFNHDCNLKSIDIPETTIKMSDIVAAIPEIDEFTKAILESFGEITISAQTTLSNHGKVAEITIPQEIIDSAKTEEQILQEMTELNNLQLNVDDIDLTELENIDTTNTDVSITPDMSLEDFDNLLNTQN